MQEKFNRWTHCEEMSFLKKSIVSIFHRNSEIWKRIGVFTELTIGIVLIAGANGFALAYIPITFLAVPVASLGTLIGTFVLGNMFASWRKETCEKKLKEEREAGKRDAEQERLLRDNEKTIERITQDRDRYKSRCEHLERMGASITSFNPTLKIVLWNEEYHMTDFKEDSRFVCGKSNGVFKRDDNPISEKVQSVVRLKGTRHYCLDLEKLKVRCLHNRLYFPEDLTLCFDVLEEGQTSKQLLWQRVRREWDQDEELENEEKYSEKGKLEKTTVEDLKSDRGVALNSEHIEEVKIMLGNTRRGDLQHLAQQRIRDLFSITGYKIIFDEKKLHAGEVIDISKFIKDFNQSIQECEFVDPVRHVG